MKTVLLQELDTPPGHRPLELMLLALALLFLPHIFIFIPVLILFLYAALGWRWLALQRSYPMPPRWLRIVLAVIGFVAIWALYGSINGPEPGMALLSVMIVLKLTEVQRVRDALMVVVLGYFIVFASYLYSQDIPHVVMQTPSLIFLTAALLVLGHNSEEARVGKSMRRSARLILQALPFAILLFVLFPRIPGPLWGVPTASGDAVSGLDDRMTPGSISNLVLSEEVAFRVRFDDENDIPPPWLRYWRGPTLHLFNGRSWWRGFEALSETENYTVRGEPFSYTVMQEPTNQPWLFAIPLPQDATDDTRLTRDFTFTARYPSAQRRQYAVQSYTDYIMSPDLSALEQRWGVQLPDTGNPRTRELVEEWQAEGLDDRAMVERALQYFATQPFYYTLQPRRLSGDMVDQFLFETREGFCEHYASAFTFMMRLAGIPSRVVTGYQGGELNEYSGFLVVRQSDAHAWSEVWYPEQGWVRVDPTAAVSPERIRGGITAALSGDESAPDYLRGLGSDFWTNMEIRWEALNSLWNEFFLGYGPEIQEQFLDWLGMEDPDWRKMALWLFGLLGVGGIVLTLYLAWTNRAPARDAAQRIFLRLKHRLDAEAEPHEGPRDFIARMQRKYPAREALLEEFLRHYLEIRYGASAAGKNDLRRLARNILAQKA